MSEIEFKNDLIKLPGKNKLTELAEQINLANKREDHNFASLLRERMPLEQALVIDDLWNIATESGDFEFMAQVLESIGEDGWELYFEHIPKDKNP